jgi:SNF2 family DNA or RNA helicase
MLKDEPYPHQREIAGRIERQRNLLVAADMGTGKSRAVLMACADDQFLVIVAPVAVGPAWVKQIASWDDGRQVFQAFDGHANRRQAAVTAAVGAAGRRALILNYDWFWRDKPLAALLAAARHESTRPAAIVADESHRAKSPSSRASRALHRLAAACPTARRLALTGTPMPLGPQDVYAQARFVDPSVFGTNHRSFLSQFFHTDPIYPSRVTGTKNQEEFSRRLDRICYRVRADDVLQLPEALHETVRVQLPPLVERVYREIERAVALEIAGGTVNLANGMVKLLRLQQATSSYLGTDDGDRYLEPVPAKIAALEDWMQDLPADEPVAVFCRFRHDLDELSKMSARRGRRHAELSGRENTLDAWQRGECDMLAVQIQSGGAGIDLTRCGDRPCRYVAYLSVGFNGGDYQQSLARVRRPGQTSSFVRYYHFVAAGTVDEAVYGALRKKANVVEAVLGSLAGTTPARV